MTRYRFVHAADLHLDSPFRGLLREASTAASHLHEATFRTYDAIIDLCIREQVDALLVAGDIYDGAERSLHAQLRFQEGLRRLDQAGVRAFICHGNHDPLDGWEARLDLPPGAVRFGPEVTSAPLRADDPASPLVYGISYPTRDVRENLVPRFPAPQPGRAAIGLLHANVGANTGHEAYAPCTLEDLVRTGYDYWALGHVHTRQVLRDRAPAVVYPGNPQGRHINEPGPRGVYLVELDDHHEIRLEFHALDRVRWERLDVAIDDLEDEQALLSACEAAVTEARQQATSGPTSGPTNRVGDLSSSGHNTERALVYGLRLTGRGPVHATLARTGFLDDTRRHLNDRFATGDTFAFCERIEAATAPEVNRDELAQSQDLLGDLLRLVDELRADPEALEGLREELTPLYDHQRTRRYLRRNALDHLDLDALLAEAERTLINELHDTEAR